jgi:lysozyme
MPSDRLLAFIEEHEGFRSDAYPDPALGWSLPTIGFGRVEGVYRGEITNRAHEQRWLLDTLGYIQDSIIEIIDDKVSLNLNQLEALCSFCFNLGMAAFQKSTLLVMLNLGDFSSAANQFPRWVFAGKPPRVLPGLVRRREAERLLFLSESTPVI